MSEQQQHPDEQYGPYEQPRVIEGTVLGHGAESTDPRTGHGRHTGYDQREDHSGGSFDGPPPPPPMPPEPPTLLGHPAGPEAHGGHGGRPGRGLLRGRLALVTAVAAIAAVIGGVTGGLVADRQPSGSRVGTIASPVSARTDGSANVPAIASAVSPSVVQITVKSGNGTATGTGVVLNDSGRILTNFHVIDTAADGSGRITVTFKDGSTAPATVTGTDKKLDVAVITATGTKSLAPAVLGDSSTVAVGDPVVAIGNPDGLTGTVTSGIISAENRDVTVQLDEGTTSGNGGFGFPDLPGLRGSIPQQRSGGDTTTYKAFQTDAALNPGNSGGPLINANGQVIAINSAMYAPNGANSTAGGGSSTAGSVGLGFAIPINDVKQVLPKLEAGQNL
ncbi:S1C family serine protease [Kitasatospora sp. NPDC059648]|uniref:S1C family serine protease n=1 Tax=Kitasatospora sp. NPDC059648 TaxID=3346894 RepID=UPI003673EE3A